MSRRYRARRTTIGPWQCVDYVVGSSAQNIERAWDTMFPDLPDDRMEDPTGGETLEVTNEGFTTEYVFADVPPDQINEASDWFIGVDEYPE